jgi:hypothetical protein
MANEKRKIGKFMSELPTLGLPDEAAEVGVQGPTLRAPWSPAVLNGLGDVDATDGELFRGVDAHFDAPSGPTEQRDLNGPIGEKLCHGHAPVRAIRGLDHDGLISTAA